MDYVGIPQGEDLAHYGVLGMKWGVRHDRKSGGGHGSPSHQGSAAKSKSSGSTEVDALKKKYNDSKAKYKNAKAVFRGLQYARSRDTYAAITQRALRKEKKGEYKEAKATKKADKKALKKAIANAKSIKGQVDRLGDDYLFRKKKCKSPYFGEVKAKKLFEYDDEEGKGGVYDYDNPKGAGKRARARVTAALSKEKDGSSGTLYADARDWTVPLKWSKKSGKISYSDSSGNKVNEKVLFSDEMLSVYNDWYYTTNKSKTNQSGSKRLAYQQTDKRKKKRSNNQAQRMNQQMHQQVHQEFTRNQMQEANRMMQEHMWMQQQHMGMW